MVYVSIDEWAEKMHMTHRQAGDLLRAKKVPGAIKMGKFYRIPDVSVPSGLSVDTPVSTTPVAAVVQVADSPPASDRIRIATEEAELLELDARKAEAAQRIHDAKVASSGKSSDLLDEREKTLDEREATLREKAANLDLLDADMKRRNEELAKASYEDAKTLDVEKAELEQQKANWEIVLAEGQKQFAAERDKVLAELAGREAEIIEKASSQAEGILADATLQAGNIIAGAKSDVDRLNARDKELDERKAELDKATTRLTAETAVVERCMSRLNRDVTELSMRPPKDWPKKINDLIVFIQGELR
jgi:hypothetical protein